jgi:D-alanyl-D-alanine dipeptidase
MRIGHLVLTAVVVVAAGSVPASAASPLPPGFVYLRDVDPTIRQDMRYATAYNFTGRRVPGYGAAECVLTRAAAVALSRVQAELRPRGYALKVYDCYRPTRAVRAFVRWAADPARREMKRVFFPRVDKRRVFALGYVAAKSSHSRGSTMDLTIVRRGAPKQPVYAARAVTGSCIAPPGERPPDNALDFGTGYDCFDVLAHTANPAIRGAARRHRDMLVEVMKRQGFVNYDKEWWHFTLQPEPHPARAFDFPIVARP